MENAGFTIIGFEYTNYGAKEGVCIGHKVTSFGDEWVTWAFTGREDGRSYYWGHYFRTEANAYTDYHQRVKRGY